MPEPEDQEPRPVQLVDLQPPGTEVYQLWASIRESDKAQTGGRVAANLDINEPARYGATQI